MIAVPLDTCLNFAGARSNERSPEVLELLKRLEKLERPGLRSGLVAMLSSLGNHGEDRVRKPTTESQETVSQTLSSSFATNNMTCFHHPSPSPIVR